MKDLYSILGVAKDADPATIKKAFKTLARKYHPDISKNKDDTERFKEITAAHEVLGDEQKRALYDEFGEVSLRAGFDPNQARAYRGFGGGAPGGQEGGFPGGFPGGGGGGPFGFEDLFGGMFSRGGTQPTGPRAGADIEGRVEVPFMDAVRGAEIPLQVRRPATCKACHGEGGRGKRACAACKGTGRRRIRQLGMNAMVQCDECGGMGSTWTEECGECGGTGRVRELTTLNVKVPAGVTSGQHLRLRGQGGDGQKGGPAGDLILSVNVLPHPILRRDGRNLEMDLPLTLAEAIGGATVEVPTPTGRVRLKVPPGSNNGTRMRIGGRGVQEKGNAGDLYLVLRPMLPAASDAETVALAEQLDLRGARDVRADLEL